MNAGIIMAGGRSDRMGAKVDRAFLSLGPKPILAYSLIAFEECTDIDSVVVVVKRERISAVRGVAQMFGCTKISDIVAASAKLRDSLQSALEVLDDETKLVAIHDCSRPCVNRDLISDTLKAAKRNGSGVAAYKIPESIKEVERGLKATKTLERGKWWLTQTPQSFKLELLREAMVKVAAKQIDIGDASEAIETIGKSVHLVPAPLANLKVATTDDLAMVTALLDV